MPENKEALIERWEKTKEAASRKGGLSLFAKYGSPATEEGRRKGGIKSLANLRKNGIIPLFKVYKIPKTYTEQLAEYTGIMLGDGGITPGQCTVTLNSEADYAYTFFVSKLGKHLFGEEPKRFKHKGDKAITLYYNGAALVRYCISIGLKVGNKVKQQVSVPNWIESSLDYKIACLRGLMDTDGGVFLHKYAVNGKTYTYPKVSFSNRSMPLLYFVMRTLAELGFTPKLIDKIENKKVWLYNRQEVGEYLQQVGTHNPRLLKHHIGFSVLGEVA